MPITSLSLVEIVKKYGKVVKELSASEKKAVKIEKERKLLALSAALKDKKLGTKKTINSETEVIKELKQTVKINKKKQQKQQKREALAASFDNVLEKNAKIQFVLSETGMQGIHQQYQSKSKIASKNIVTYLQKLKTATK
eukprot:Lithocolla_globosa_v1_NODE_351_length_4361_cov_64.948676.p3 type:complete len:140 gc:universal NODE_351_length_4361_cov_64.948676:4220-3801(-)